MKTIRRGVVFGTFLLPHRGHEWLFRVTADLCTRATIFVCTHSKEEEDLIRSLPSKMRRDLGIYPCERVKRIDSWIAKNNFRYMMDVKELYLDDGWDNLLECYKRHGYHPFNAIISCDRYTYFFSKQFKDRPFLTLNNNRWAS